MPTLSNVGFVARVKVGLTRGNQSPTWSRHYTLSPKRWRKQGWAELWGLSRLTPSRL